VGIDVVKFFLRKVGKLSLISLFFVAWAPLANAELCLTPHGYLSLGYPGIAEANMGITVGDVIVPGNSQSHCFGAMFDLGINSGSLRVAAGIRSFQREWTVAAQLDVFVYEGFKGSSAFPGGRCVGVEGGLAVMLPMVRIGIGKCRDWDLPLVLAHFGVFI